MRPSEFPDERSLVPYAATALLGSRVLVFAPHPDDEVLGCGGALALLRRQGARLDVVLVTDGAAGARDEAERGRIAAERVAESRRALDVLGGGAVHAGGVPDREAAARPGDVEALLSRWLVEAAPDLVFAPSPVETHPDHRAVACALLAIASRAPRDAAASALAGATVAFYEVSQPFRPNVLVDITAVLALKDAAMRAFATQAAERDYAGFMSGLNAFRRLTLPREVAAAEAFARFPGALLADPPAVLKALLPVASLPPLGLRERVGVLFSGRLP